MVLEKVSFEIVRGCQLRCVGCPNSTRRPVVKYAERSVFEACLRNTNVKGIELVRLFNFGEPLLHPNVAEFVRLIRKQRWKCKHVELSTNAQHLDVEQLTQLFKDRVLTSLAVSCDGNGTAKSYEALRPPAKWERLMAFMRTAKKLRDKYNPKVKLLTRTIIGKPMDKLRWRMALPKGWEPEFRNFILMPERKETPFKRKFRMAEGLCQYMRKPKLYVDYNGDVVGCCAHPRAFVLGNLAEQKYTEIRHSLQYKQIKSQMKHDRKSMTICSQCGIS